MAARDSGSWTGFLIMAFAVVGLVGAYATYAAQIPLERALSRDAALDAVLAGAQGTPGGTQAEASVEQLRPLLGDSADAVLRGSGDLASRVAQERGRMRAAFRSEAADIGFRLRLVIAVFTGAGALFGALVLSVVRRAA